MVASMALGFKNSAEKLLTVQLQHENSCIERNYKKLNVLHLLCHRETGKVEFGRDFFLIVQEFCKGWKVAYEFVDLVLCFLLMLYCLKESVMLRTVVLNRRRLHGSSVR